MSNKKCNLFFIGIPIVIGLIALWLVMYQFAQINNGGAPEITEKSGWQLYSDTRYHFSIVYPESMDAILSDEGVSFAARGPGVMGVKVYRDTPFQSTDEWLAAQNGERETLRKEKTIHVDGVDALVTYYVSVMPEFEETFPNEKRTVFLKDGDLYEIWTKFYDDPTVHEAVWESFEFRR